MRNTKKLLAIGAVCSALAVTPVAIGAGGPTAKATPSHVKEGKTESMLVTGMKANEKVTSVEVAPNGQTRKLYPKAGAGGSLLVKVKAQVKGKHTWTFTGRSSHRTVKTHYVVT